ncbi:MAG: carbohydrate kinase family protein [Verrucomicrobia bacterium]|jgi:sugar/nucleoside kinase (ribokinase family)|nr:MAG: carbohydrate kinase family protein [Verrucomicrobiota bacterium]
MSQRTGILAGGNWIIDHVKIIDTWPTQDSLANIVGGSDGSGGSPYNVLVDLAKMGAPIQLAGVGLVGDDSDGHKIIADCSMYRINADAMQRTTAAPTSFTDVMTVQGTGRRTFFHARGANALLQAGHFDFTKTNARIFHLGYLLLLDGLDAPSATHGTVAAEVLARAQAAGMKTSIDVVSEDSDRFPKIVLPALQHVDVCVMNEFEAGRVTGRRIRVGETLDRAELRAAMQALLDAGVRERVVVHYPEGGCALGRDGAWDEHGSVRLPADYIVGAAGAGDAFTAGTLFGWHEGLPVREWLRHGVCAAAANLSDETCTGGVGPLAECLALGERYGFRD